MPTTTGIIGVGTTGLRTTGVGAPGVKLGGRENREAQSKGNSSELEPLLFRGDSYYMGLFCFGIFPCTT